MATAILKRRVVIGRRHDEINAVLDMCAVIDGYLFLEVEIAEGGRKKLDSLGRTNRIYDDAAQKYRAQKANNPERFKKKAAQKKVWMASKYASYCKLYIENFPLSLPVSFSHFRKTELAKNFNADPLAAVVSTYGLADAIAERKAKSVQLFKMD